MASNFDKIQIEPLDVDNYGEWRGQMVPFLTYLGFYVAIEDPESEEGKKVDAKCRALIILKCKTFHHPEVEDKKTAKAVWDELETLYKKVSNSRIAQLKIALQSLKMEGNEPVVKYIARTRALASELKGAGKPVDEDDLAINVLNGLTGEFKTLRTILLNGTEELKLSVIQSKLIEHEQALSFDEEKEEEEKNTSMAFTAKHQNFRKSNGANGKEYGERACFGCGKPGHIQKRCRTTGPECYKCGKRGHIERECKVEERGNSFCGKTTMAFTVLNKGRKEDGWILDSGSRSHLCNKRELFKNLKPAHQEDKVWGISGEDKSELKVEAYGDVRLSCNLSDGSVREVDLLNVALVPKATVNLVSMSCLTKKGATVRVEKKKAVVMLGNQEVLQAKDEDGLFVVEVLKVTASQDQSQEQGTKKEANIVEGKQPLEFVHVHVNEGEKLLVTVVDDFSKVSAVQPISSKKESEAAVLELLEKLERQSWKKVKMLVVNGSSLKENGETYAYCEKKGIKVLQQKSGPAKEVSESLLKKADKALKQTKLSESLWREAVGMANVSRNREKEDENSRSPWEKFDKSSPWKVEHVFGEKVDFNKGSEKGIFVGYAGQDGKSFRVLRLKNGEVVVTKEVKFKHDERKTEEYEDLIDLESEVEGDQVQKEKNDETAEAVGAEAGGARAVRRSERERKPPEKLSLFARTAPRF